MISKQFIEILTSARILPLFYDDNKKNCIDVLQVLRNANIKMLEFTNRGKYARENFVALAEANNAAAKPLILSVGTVRTGEEAAFFTEAGAQIIISPFYDEAVCQTTQEAGKIYIPGCFTPTEIHHAYKAGCSIVKLFPGSVLLPDFLKAVKPVFPDVHFIITGGVTLEKENLCGWFDAGADAVGLGSCLISKQIINSKDWVTLKDNVTTSQAHIKAFMN